MKITKPVYRRIHLIGVLALLFIPALLFSQENSKNFVYEPEVGQEGKDVVWVPTPQSLVDKMLEIAKVTSSDFLIDLGSGDGRTVITAAKRGIKAIGIEYNPDMVELSKRNAAEAGVTGSVEFLKTDLFEYDFSKATVITMFLLPEINMRLRPKLLEMKPGTRIVTNTFTMEDWHWDDSADSGDESTNWNTCYLWIVPARAEGVWKTEDGIKIMLLQNFQMLTGELTKNNKTEPISEGKLRGTEITFTAGGIVYTGTVDQNTIKGSFTVNGKQIDWKASR
jgi:phospholipid N-methyltransferase